MFASIRRSLGDTMASKTFNEKLKDSKDMPKIVVIENSRAIRTYGGTDMLIAPPIFYDEIMAEVPRGKVITAVDIREFLAKQYDADFTCPMTSGIFINLAARASCERDHDRIPFWRTLKSNGELNSKYPGGIEYQKKMLEAEGLEIYCRGRKHFRYYVKNYENNLYKLE